MKKRKGFVSNSSSCAFIVDMDYVSKKQLYMINYHLDYAQMKFPDMHDYMLGDRDWWEISIGDKLIEMSTLMDNFDMHSFLMRIGIPEEEIHENQDRFRQ